MTSYNSPFTGQVIQPTDVSYRSITLSANVVLSWPLNGNATPNYAARIMDVTATTGGLSLGMPPANQTSVGNDALIRNTGANTFTVTDFDGATIVSIAAGQTKYIYITDNPDEGGTWGTIAFGVGTSSPDAASLAGAGLLASGATLNQSHPTNGIASGYTFATTDRALTCVYSSGAGTATLPGSATLGNNWFTLVKNNGTGSLVISTSGIDTIDGLTTKTFQPDDSAFIVCTGSTFITVGFGRSTLYNFSALTKSVTTGAYTLTANEAANLIHEYIGSLTGNVTVTYPPVVSFYVITNQVTDNGYSLTITTGVSGGADATIPAGETSTLICDGTNFFNANTVQSGATTFSLVNGTAASPSLSFASEPTTGIYRPGTNQFGISINGTLRANISATGLAVTGTGNFTGGISGGLFS
jgi:hypothetical protein